MRYSNHFFRIFWRTESSKEQQYIEIEIFCNIINVFTVIDQAIASLLNKMKLIKKGGLNK